MSSELSSTDTGDTHHEAHPAAFQVPSRILPEQLTFQVCFPRHPTTSAPARVLHSEVITLRMWPCGASRTKTLVVRAHEPYPPQAASNSPIGLRYTLGDKLGHGQYGVVCDAIGARTPPRTSVGSRTVLSDALKLTDA